MNYLIDTQYLIWTLLFPDRVQAWARKILSAGSTIKFVSKITFWEIALKFSTGRLDLKGISPEGILEAAVSAGFDVLDITVEDIVSSHLLPFHKDHLDPFDRLLIWQCIRNDLTFLTADRKIRDYSEHGLRLPKQV